MALPNAYTHIPANNLRMKKRKLKNQEKAVSLRAK